MRHINPTYTSYFSPYRRTTISKPYDHQYIDAYEKSGFATANSKKRYVKILQYIADHDGCKRADILRDVFKLNVNLKDSWYKNALRYRGHWSAGFSQLLYINVIDYDKNYCYHITERGLKVLKTAYLNDNLKIVNAK